MIWRFYFTILNLIGFSIIHTNWSSRILYLKGSLSALFSKCIDSILKPENASACRLYLRFYILCKTTKDPARRQKVLALWRTVLWKLLKLKPSLLSLAFNYGFYTARLNYYIFTKIIQVDLCCFMMVVSYLFLYFPI